MFNKWLFLFLISGANLVSQNHKFYTQTAGFDHPAPQYKKIIIPEKFKSNDAVIISDNVEFRLLGSVYKTLVRNVLVKINSEKGKAAFNAISLPESFDVADDVELWQQGRQVRNTIPFIYEFNIQYFIARIIKPNGRVITLPLKTKSQKIRWMRSSGEFLDDYINSFLLEDIEVGDLIEYSYEVDYISAYGSNIVYLSSRWPKIMCYYKFNYAVEAEYKKHKFIFVNNVPDTCLKRIEEPNTNNITLVSEEIKLHDVVPANYFIHSFPAKQLPQVYFNMYYPVLTVNKSVYSIARPIGFAWLPDMDTTKDATKFHTKFATGIRKFVNSIPVFENDSDHVKFLKAFCDTLNAFKYYSANNMYYNEPILYNVSSVDHLQKRRISQMFMSNVYEAILGEKNMFYYITNVQDKRLGELSPFNRINTAYENSMLAIPYKNSFLYVLPRSNGLKYHLNELPFYFEGAPAALFPINFRTEKIASDSKYFKFTKTRYDTYNENVRVENAVVNVNTDSMKCDLAIKENLAGQFSTIIRPIYLGDYIDSTVNSIYFKKCTDLPFASKVKQKLSSKVNEYPFRYVFNCTETVPVKKQGEINLHNWFSFVINSNLIPEKPTQDYYFDFQFSDVYNFIFKFDKPVIITNGAQFNKSEENDWFEITSSLKNQDDMYVLSLTVKVKKDMVPKEESEKLMNFVKELDAMNDLTISYSKQ